MNAPIVKPRTRAGSWDTFDRRYKPTTRGEEVLRDWDDPALQGVDERLIWTVVSVDGREYVTPGYATVNYLGRILCAVPWGDTEFSNPGYSY
jgi:hypothetical protein